MTNLTYHYPFTNPPLPYAYQALEPYIDEKTMKLHHDRHLQTYVDNLNKALADYSRFHNWTLEQLIYNIASLPEEIQTAVRNNGGGVYNHLLYFTGLAPASNQMPTGALADAIRREYGSLDAFLKKLKEAALSVFGSGYAWLVVAADGSLMITTTKNQDTPLPLGLCPVFNLDVWEHAYYLKHYNLRADYIDDLFHVINWEQAGQRYMACFQIQ